MELLEIRVPDNRIVNLTSEPINVYAATGEIITYLPEYREIDSSHYFVVDDGRVGENILVVAQKGIGRNKKEVSMLFSSINERVRVYPRGAYC